MLPGEKLVSADSGLGSVCLRVTRHKQNGGGDYDDDDIGSVHGVSPSRHDRIYSVVFVVEEADAWTSLFHWSLLACCAAA
jgi:hypothetical protein